MAKQVSASLLPDLAAQVIHCRCLLQAEFWRLAKKIKYDVHVNGGVDLFSRL